MVYKIKIPKRQESSKKEGAIDVEPESPRPLQIRLFSPLMLIAALSNLFVVIYLLFFQENILFILAPILGKQTYDMIFYHALLHLILTIILIFITVEWRRFYGYWLIALISIILSLTSSCYIYDQFLLRPISDGKYTLILINVVISIIIITYLLASQKKLYEPLPRTRKALIQKKAFTILITFFILTSIIFAWYVLIRPITVNEFLYRSFNPGDEITVAGHITEIEDYDLSYGKYKLIKLDNYSSDAIFYRLLVDTDKNYSIGDYFKTKIKFYEYEFNGIAYPCSPELYYIYGLIPASQEIIIDSVNEVGGMTLNFVRNNEDGTSEWEVFTSDNDKYPLQLLNLTLRKSLDYSGITSWDEVPNSYIWEDYEIPEKFNHYNSLILSWIEYGMVIGNFNDDYHDEIDVMTTLEDGTSVNGLVRYIDENANNMLDDYDRFILNLPPTKNDYSFESYWLQIGSDDRGRSIGSISKYILNSGRGVLHDYTMGYDDSRISLKYSSHIIVQDKVSTTIEVNRIENNISFPYTNLTLELTSDDTDNYRWRLGESTLYQNNVSTEYRDSNQNGLLDSGDLIIIRGNERDKYVGLSLRYDATGTVYGNIGWVTGYGHISGAFPEITFLNAGLISSNTYKIDMDVPFSHPEFKLNDNVYFDIFKNGSHLENKALLTAGNFVSYDGVDITYVDYDNDNLVSDSDYLLVTTDYTGELRFRFFHFNRELYWEWNPITLGEE